MPFFSLSGSPRDDEAVKLKALVDSLLRTVQLQHELAEPQKNPSQHLVFVSCGQFTDEEIQLGKEIAKMVRQLTGYEGYFAENQNSLQGLSQHIFGALNRAAGLIAVMHHRGRVETPSGTHIRGSVWVEQEIAIAAFLAHIQGRELPVLI